MSGDHDILRDVRAFLAFQGELGWQGARRIVEVARPPEVATGPRVQVAQPTEEVTVASEAAPSFVTPGPSSLDDVRAVLGECTRCKLCKGRKSIVFGTGSASARLMFIGEGPGQEEDLRGEPFVGAAGQLLTKMIEAMGFARDQVYIANVVKCRPPQNRDPEPDEVAACEPFLKQQIAAIKPSVIVALGRHAAQTLLRDSTPITRMRGKWREYEGIALMPTYHPAYLLRNPAEKRPVWDDLKNVMARLAR